MHFKSLTIFHHFITYRRQLLFIIALAAPLMVFAMVTHQTVAPSKHDTTAKGNTQPAAINNTDFPFLSLDYMRKTTAIKLRKAESMTAEEYAEKRHHNRHLPFTLDAYREQLRTRLAQLQAMTPQEWQDEVNQKTPHVQWTGRPNQSANPPPATGFSPIHGTPDEASDPEDIPDESK